MCGEKDLQNAVLGGNLGSPPRVRGKDETGLQHGNTCGITPACAGKRFVPERQCSRWGDHPRVCGEKYTTFRNQLKTAGSPPRVRGKVCLVVGLVVRCRITPACAGKSLQESVSQ